MKKILTTLLILTPLAGQTQAAMVFGGDFQLYKPGTGYTVAGELSGPGAFDSYAQGVGDGVNIAGGTGLVNFADSTSGSTADLPGWVLAPGKSNPDSGLNGVGGSTGLNIFAAWGGQQRIMSDAAIGSVSLGYTYTITAQIDGPSGGPMEGDLAFYLEAGGVQLTPTSALTPFTATPGTFQTISQTFDLTTLPVGVTAGDDLKIVLGVQDSNTLGSRMIWDNVTFDAVPEPSSALLLGLGGLALIRRKRN